MFLVTSRLHMKTHVILLVIVTIAVNSVLSQYKYEPVIILEKSLTALDHLLDYLIKHNDGLIEDTAFGVVLSRSILKQILDNHQPTIQQDTFSHLYKDLPLYMSIEKLKQKCEHIVNIHKNDMNKPDIYHDYPMIKEMLDYDLWKINGTLKFDELLWKKPHENKDIFNMYLWMLEHHKTYVMSEYSSPNEKQSDHCISELLENKNSSMNSCYVSPQCWKIMTTGPRAFGYPLTHRLIYVQLARQLQCKNKPYFKNVQERIDNLCAEILTEAEIISILGFPVIFQDLFLEQVVFCGGIEKYNEFLRLNWMDEILSLQREDGCYGDYKEDEDVDTEDNVAHRRKKRYDAVMENKCLMHMTGVAAAALSTNIQALIDLDSTLLEQNRNTEYKNILHVDKLINTNE